MFEFSGAGPFQDRRHLLPDLAWTPLQPDAANKSDAVWDGKSWLAGKVPASRLVASIQNTGRFSIHMRFVPAQADGVDAKIVSISVPSGPSDLEIRQESLALSFWYRTRVSSPPFQLEWSIPRIFAVNQERNIAFSYDGAKLWAYVDGKLLYSGYRLSPAIPLVRLIRHPKSSELQGYRYAFYAIIFFPAGCLLGFAERKGHRLFLFAPGVILPSVLFELLIVHAGSQPISVGNLLLATIMSIAGWIWINLEGSALRVLAQTNVSRTS